MDKKKPLNTDKIREYQEKPGGKFREGNPGRPKGAKNKFSRELLEKAIEAEEKMAKEQGGTSVFQQFVRMAYKEPSVMIALMRKFVPDLEKTEILGDLNQQVDLSGLTVDELRALAYGNTINKQNTKNNRRTKSGNSKAGKTGAGKN